MNTLSHVAIIMDGNGRWASKKNKPRKYGHLKGTENIKNLIPYFIKKKNSISNIICICFRQLE